MSLGVIMSAKHLPEAFFSLCKTVWRLSLGAPLDPIINWTGKYFYPANIFLANSSQKNSRGIQMRDDGKHPEQDTDDVEERRMG